MSNSSKPENDTNLELHINQLYSRLNNLLINLQDDKHNISKRNELRELQQLSAELVRASKINIHSAGGNTPSIDPINNYHNIGGSSTLEADGSQPYAEGDNNVSCNSILHLPNFNSGSITHSKEPSSVPPNQQLKLYQMLQCITSLKIQLSQTKHEVASQGEFLSSYTSAIVNEMKRGLDGLKADQICNLLLVESGLTDVWNTLLSAKKLIENSLRCCNNDSRKYSKVLLVLNPLNDNINKLEGKLMFLEREIRDIPIGESSFNFGNLLSYKTGDPGEQNNATAIRDAFMGNQVIQTRLLEFIKSRSTNKDHVKGLGLGLVSPSDLWNLLPPSSRRAGGNPFSPTDLNLRSSRDSITGQSNRCSLTELEDFVYSIINERGKAAEGRKRDVVLEDLLAATQFSGDSLDIDLFSSRKRANISNKFPSPISSNFEGSDLEEKKNSFDPKKIKKIEFSDESIKDELQKMKYNFTHSSIDKLVLDQELKMKGTTKVLKFDEYLKLKEKVEKEKREKRLEGKKGKNERSPECIGNKDPLGFKRNEHLQESMESSNSLSSSFCVPEDLGDTIRSIRTNACQTVKHLGQGPIRVEVVGDINDLNDINDINIVNNLHSTNEINEINELSGIHYPGEREKEGRQRPTLPQSPKPENPHPSIISPPSHPPSSVHAHKTPQSNKSSHSSKSGLSRKSSVVSNKGRKEMGLGDVQKLEGLQEIAEMGSDISSIFTQNPSAAYSSNRGEGVHSSKLNPQPDRELTAKYIPSDNKAEQDSLNNLESKGLKGVLKDTPKEDIPKDIGKDIRKDIPKDIPKDIGKDIPKDIGKDIPTDIGKDIPKDIGKDVSTKATNIDNHHPRGPVIIRSKSSNRLGAPTKYKVEKCSKGNELSESVIEESNSVEYIESKLSSSARFPKYPHIPQKSKLPPFPHSASSRLNQSFDINLVNSSISLRGERAEVGDTVDSCKKKLDFVGEEYKCIGKMGIGNREREHSVPPQRGKKVVNSNNPKGQSRERPQKRLTKGSTPGSSSKTHSFSSRSEEGHLPGLKSGGKQLKSANSHNPHVATPGTGGSGGKSLRSGDPKYGDSKYGDGGSRNRDGGSRGSLSSLGSRGSKGFNPPQTKTPPLMIYKAPEGVQLKPLFQGGGLLNPVSSSEGFAKYHSVTEHTLSSETKAASKEGASISVGTIENQSLPTLEYLKECPCPCPCPIKRSELLTLIEQEKQDLTKAESPSGGSITFEVKNKQHPSKYDLSGCKQEYYHSAQHLLGSVSSHSALPPHIYPGNNKTNSSLRGSTSGGIVYTTLGPPNPPEFSSVIQNTNYNPSGNNPPLHSKYSYYQMLRAASPDSLQEDLSINSINTSNNLSTGVGGGFKGGVIYQNKKDVNNLKRSKSIKGFNAVKNQLQKEDFSSAEKLKQVKSAKSLNKRGRSKEGKSSQPGFNLNSFFKPTVKPALPVIGEAVNNSINNYGGGGKGKGDPQFNKKRSKSTKRYQFGGHFSLL